MAGTSREPSTPGGGGVPAHRVRPVTAESVVRQQGGVNLADALELTSMIALRDYDRGRRAGARWLQRWLDETAGVTIDDAVFVAACLAQL